MPAWYGVWTAMGAKHAVEVRIPQELMREVLRLVDELDSGKSDVQLQPPTHGKHPFAVIDREVTIQLRATKRR